MAYAVRCARRVQPVLREAGEEVVQATENALKLASRFAQGEKLEQNDLFIAAEAAEAAKAEAAHAAALAAVYAVRVAETAEAAEAAHDTNAAAAAAGIAAIAAGTAAEGAANTFVALGLAAHDAAPRDFEALSRKNFGKPGNPGRSIDPSADGPLGDYWHGDPPDWYEEWKPLLDARLGQASGEYVQQLAKEKSELAAQIESREKELAQLKEQIEQRIIEAPSPDVLDELGTLRERLAGLRAERENLSRDLKKALDDVATTANQRNQFGNERDQLEKELRTTQIAAAAAQQELSLERDRLAGELDEAKLRLSYRKPIKWRDLSELFTKENVLILCVIAFMLACVVLSMIAASEVQGRQQLVANIQGRMDESQQRIVSAGENANATPANDPKSELQRLYEIRSAANVLIATGAESERHTLNGLKRRLLRIGMDSDSAPATGDLDAAGLVARHVFFIRYQSSDLLLSFVVIVAGCIGAIIAAMRDDNVFTFKDLGLGLGAGLITFLMIRSGRAVFLLNPGGTTFVLNPYTSAFFGLAAGLFTERAYGLLTELIDQVIERLKVAFIDNGSGTSESRTQSKTTERTPSYSSDQSSATPSAPSSEAAPDASTTAPEGVTSEEHDAASNEDETDDSDEAADERSSGG